MSILFTQYLRPDGRTRPMTIDMPEKTEEKARFLIDAGCHFDIEELSTGMVSMTCETSEDMVSIELSTNGPEIVDKVESLIDGAFAIVSQKREIP